jgi:hypothetical protein
MANPDLTELRAMRDAVARYALENKEAMPIFEQIDGDFHEAEILAANDPVAILRAVIEKRKVAA